MSIRNILRREQKKQQQLRPKNKRMSSKKVEKSKQTLNKFASTNEKWKWRTKDKKKIISSQRRQTPNTIECDVKMWLVCSWLSVYKWESQHFASRRYYYKLFSFSKRFNWYVYSSLYEHIDIHTYILISFYSASNKYIQNNHKYNMYMVYVQKKRIFIHIDTVIGRRQYY